MDPARPDPSLASLLSGDGRVWLGGGEPTLRADLPDLLAGLGERLLGLCTDGWLLGQPTVVGNLQRMGLTTVRIPFHSARAPAHDWLAGSPGAQKRTWQALKTCLQAGLRVQVEVVLTRPTLPHLDATLGLLTRLPLACIVVRPLEGDCPGYAALAARWPLARHALELAVAMARDGGMQVQLEGFPACAVGNLGDLRSPQACELGKPCSRCPGAPGCLGISVAYLEAFGWQDLAKPHQRSDIVTLAILPGEQSRTVRHRLVQAARTPARTLRLLGLDHPEGPALLAEALALSFARVEACGLLHRVAKWSARDRLRLRGLARLDGLWLGNDAPSHDRALGSPGAWDAAWQLLATMECETPSWPDSFRFLRDQACLPDRVAGLPPCLRPLGWKNALASSSAVGPSGPSTPCPVADLCAASAECPGLAEGLDPKGIAPL